MTNVNKCAENWPIALVTDKLPTQKEGIGWQEQNATESLLQRCSGIKSENM